MPKSLGEEFMDKYGKELEERERGNIANGASEPVQTLSVTSKDVETYTVPLEPKEGETKITPGKTPEEWLETLRKTAGISPEKGDAKDEAHINALREKMERLEPGSTTKRPY